MTEGVVGLDTYSATARPALAKGFASTVQYLVATQNPSGSWGTLRSSDQQRSPRVRAWAQLTSAQLGSVLGSWVKAMRDAVRNKER